MSPFVAWYKIYIDYFLLYSFVCSFTVLKTYLITSKTFFTLHYSFSLQSDYLYERVAFSVFAFPQWNGFPWKHVGRNKLGAKCSNNRFLSFQLREFDWLKKNQEEEEEKDKKSHISSLSLYNKGNAAVAVVVVSLYGIIFFHYMVVIRDTRGWSYFEKAISSLLET